MEQQLALPSLRDHYIFKLVQRHLFSHRTAMQIRSAETDRRVSVVAIAESTEVEGVAVEYLEKDPDAAYDVDSSSSRKRSKKRKIYCFNCNRQEFHIMAYKGTSLHSLLVGMTFGLARIFGPYRCTCCGKKRAMFADFCSFSYHWRMASERRLSKTGRRRRSNSGRRRK